MMALTILEILSSGVRKMLLEEVAKDKDRPVSAYALARVSGYTVRAVSEECKRLVQAGILKPVEIGKGQAGYIYNDGPDAQRLRTLIVNSLQEKQSNSVVEKIAKRLRMTDYYISLPLALKVSYDVFYAPNYLLVVVDKDNRDAVNFLRNLAMEIEEGKLIIKEESLWGRKFKLDEVIGASLASIEQAIADGLGYYTTIKDTEIIRVLLARTSIIDIEELARLSDIGAASRAYTLLRIKNNFVQDNSILEFQKRAIRNNVDRFFLDDLKSEILPILFPNESYKTEQSQALNNALKSLTVTT